MKNRLMWRWLVVLPAGFVLGCTAPVAPSPQLSSSSVLPTTSLPATPEALEVLRGEIEQADKFVRNAADYLERVCPTVPSSLPVDEEMCRQIKPLPDSPKGKLATAEVHCQELVDKYNDAVTALGAPRSEQITLGVTPNRKYGDTITCS